MMQQKPYYPCTQRCTCQRHWTKLDWCLLWPDPIWKYVPVLISQTKFINRGWVKTKCLNTSPAFFIGKNMSAVLKCEYSAKGEMPWKRIKYIERLVVVDKLHELITNSKAIVNLYKWGSLYLLFMPDHWGIELHTEWQQNYLMKY